MSKFRFPTILGLAILLIGLAAGVVLVKQRQQLSSKAAEAAPTPENIAVSNITEKSFTVSWTTATPVIGYLQTGLAGDSLSRRVADDRDQQLAAPVAAVAHYVTVNGLEANTTYQFRIGEGVGASFDQGGAPFSVKTASALAGSLSPDTAQGSVKTIDGIPAGGVIVYAQFPGAQLMTALTTSTGNWIIPLSTIRLGDLSNWANYDHSATTYALRADGGGTRGKAEATLTTALDRPVPPMVLGQTYDFRKSREPADDATTLPGSLQEQSQAVGGGGPSSMFNFDSLGPVTPVSQDVTIDNPAIDGEIIDSDKPELFGRGPKGVEVEILVESPQPISGNTVISNTGNWSFPVPTSLAPGEHTVTATWTDAQGIIQVVKRSFVVNAAGNDPEFTATQSGKLSVVPTTKPSPTVRPSLTPTVPPRTSLPSTASGTPKSGSLTPSIALFIIGLLFTAAGAFSVLGRNEYGR